MYSVTVQISDRNSLYQGHDHNNIYLSFNSLSYIDLFINRLCPPRQCIKNLKFKEHSIITNGLFFL